MKSRLTALFCAILMLMLWVTTWASLQESLWSALPRILADPWEIASLADAYCGFLTFYVWVFYREGRLGRRLLWLGLILILGNIAMASYVLIQLYRLPKEAGPRELLWNPELRG